MIDDQAATNTSQRTNGYRFSVRFFREKPFGYQLREKLYYECLPPNRTTLTARQTDNRQLFNSAGFSRLLVIWGITLIAGLICLGVTLLLIERSKRVMLPIAPPLLPTAANPSDTPPEPQEVNLFLLDATTLTLVPIKTERRLHRELTPRLSQVVRVLIQETPPNFRNTIPRGTELNEVYIDSQQTAYLDFSSHLTDGHIGGTTAEFLTVTAILKTVFDAFPDDIKQVQILIDGEAVKTIAGHLNLSQPLRLHE
ncbi:MAG: GerMN domain-containing protein [Candidatus Poribacteria bacterium]|nr:GerMN domain-containing protein [Candidatus Poribacteria bacterium]